MSSTVLDRPVAPSITESPPVDAPPRRLSDAIREGARYHPQGTVYMCNPVTKNTCALGALVEGLLGPELFEREAWRGRSAAIIAEHTGLDVNQPLPLLAQDPALHPWFVRTREDVCTLGKAIIYLNDGAGWSRERIADWLQALGF